MSEQEKFRQAVQRLHLEKSLAYGNAWKKRGELISILANIARKADRLESVAAGAPATRDENLLDTAIDLLVYSIKYQTYLADLDNNIASHLFDASTAPPYSDDHTGFEALLSRLDLSALDESSFTADVAQMSAEAVTAFSTLECSFADAQQPSSVADRFAAGADLTTAAVRLIAALRHEMAAQYAMFLSTWEGEP